MYLFSTFINLIWEKKFVKKFLFNSLLSIPTSFQKYRFVVVLLLQNNFEERYRRNYRALRSHLYKLDVVWSNRKNAEHALRMINRMSNTAPNFYPIEVEYLLRCPTFQSKKN